MKKLLLLTGDIAAGKSTFSGILAQRYHAAVFQKDAIKEVLGDHIGFQDRAENKRLSNAAVELMCHIFSRIAVSGGPVILEANFHTDELEKLHTAAHEAQYAVLTLVLRGDTDVLYNRYIHRMNEENRHPVHLTTTAHIKEDFVQIAEWIRNESVIGETLVIDATDFSYQNDPALLKKIDSFMN